MRPASVPTWAMDAARERIDTFAPPRPDDSQIALAVALLHQGYRLMHVVERTALTEAQTRTVAYHLGIDLVDPLSHREHGTRAKYVIDRCRCQPCTASSRIAERDRQRQLAYCRWEPYVDAQPAREHVAALMAAGVGLKRIVKVSGVSQGAIWKLMYGRDGVPSTRIRPGTANRIFAVTSDDLADGACVDAGSTWRRIHGLIALGYSKAWIGRQLGQGGHALQLGTGLVTVRNARTVARIADEYGLTPAPVSPSQGRSVNLAMANGWTVDMVDEPLTDDGYIDEVAIERVLEGHDLRLTPAEQLEVARRVAGVTELARALHLNGGNARELFHRANGVAS